jgi:peptidoglycan/LPS O-acetylase OafA/YrhL
VPLGSRGVHRYEALDGLRGIAALSVMVGHYGQGLGAYWPPHMFLAVIAHSYRDRLRRGMPAGTYLYRRVVRLYPMFIVGLIFGAGVLYFGARNGVIAYATEDILHSVALNAVYIPFLNSGQIDMVAGQIFPADPPAWSLFLEMLASGAFLMLFDLRRRALIWMCVLSYLALTGAGIYSLMGAREPGSASATASTPAIFSAASHAWVSASCAAC